MAHTDEIAHLIADAIAPALVDFKYVRTRTQLRKVQKGAEFIDDLIVDVTSRSGASYSLAFYSGVAHCGVEKIIAELEGNKVTPYDRTVFHYSVNAQKQEVLPYSGPCWWYGMPPNFSIQEILDEVLAFIYGFVHLYYERFHSLVNMRDSLENADGLNLNSYTWKGVLAIDTYLSDHDHVMTYLSSIPELAQHWNWRQKSEFARFYEAISQKNPELFSEPHDFSKL